MCIFCRPLFTMLLRIHYYTAVPNSPLFWPLIQWRELFLPNQIKLLVCICSVREQRVLSAIFFFYYYFFLLLLSSFALRLQAEHNYLSASSTKAHLGEGSPFIRQSRDILVYKKRLLCRIVKALSSITKRTPHH